MKRIILLCCLVLSVISSEYEEKECRYVVAVTPPLSPMSSTVMDLGVYAPLDKQIAASSVLEYEPSAAFPAKFAGKSVLQYYAHGLNKTHTVFFFGVSSLLNHGVKNLIENKIEFAGYGNKYGHPVNTLLALHDIEPGQEMFNYYHTKISETVALSWFERRGFPETNTSDNNHYSSVLNPESTTLPGCADNSHISINPTDLSITTRLQIEEGDVLETNRVLLFFDSYFSALDTEDNVDKSLKITEELFWQACSSKRLLSLGVILPFAEFGTDAAKVNVKAEYWNNQLFYEHDMGVMKITATSKIEVGEKLYFYSQSDTKKIFPVDLYQQLEDKLTLVQRIQDLYLKSSFEGLAYTFIIVVVAITFAIC